MSLKAHVVAGTVGGSAHFCNIQLIYSGYLLITVKMYIDRGGKLSEAVAKNLFLNSLFFIVFFPQYHLSLLYPPLPYPPTPNFLFYTELSFLISPSQSH